MDLPLAEVVAELSSLERARERFAQTLRESFDQIYDGQNTGRYSFDQLFKTEKTHFGSIVEINLQREFEFEGGAALDFEIAGHEVDCKYSMRAGGWMIPMEAVGELCLVVTADDRAARWSAGVVRCTEDRLTMGGNRDRKRSITSSGQEHIRWIWSDAEMPPNVLLQLDPPALDRILSHKSGQARLNELFRLVQGVRVPRGTVLTLGQQKDPMKRVRENGGCRTHLRPEGIAIFGDSAVHRELAVALQLPEPHEGEFVAATLARSTGSRAVEIDGSSWVVVEPGDSSDHAPQLPRE